jgi:dUTP pyrophosphatase
MQVKVKRLTPTAALPEYANPGDACFDIRCTSDTTSQVLLDDVPVTFDTGLAFEIPEGWAMLVYSRSGTGFKHATRLSNCVGVIDSGYRGELKVQLICDTSRAAPLTVNPGDRIAQGMLIPITPVTFEEVVDLSDTVRGAGGFGSTGVK